jgi:glycine/D-amino acid oxidase-like deaminating enzyme
MGLTRKRELRDGDAVWNSYAVPRIRGAKRDALTHTKTGRIERKLQRLFPSIDSRAVVSWTGSFGGSPNGMPTIGAIPRYPNCYAVMGYGGNGITFSMLATKLITAAILRRTDPDARLFAFQQRIGAA